MIRKVYSYPGIIAGDIQVKVGRALVRVPFKDGYLDKKLNRPATYVTGDPSMQDMIERSELFGTRIFLKSSYVDDEEQVQAAGASPAVEGESHPEVTSFEEAVAVLKACPGVKAVQLRTPESVKKIALAKGISFPNYNFE